MLQPTETDKAYIAGIIDGEGCIGLNEHRRLGARCHTPSVVASVQVVMTDAEAVNFIAERYKGRVRHSAGRDITRKAYFTFNASDRREVEVLVKDIYPYLKIKVRQADVLLDYLTSPKLRGGRGHDVSDEVMFLRRVLVADMHALNQRGGVTLS